ncbi:MAG: hypothetical protein ACE5F3_08735 [Mariprofundaceae bacterium]
MNQAATRRADKTLRIFRKRKVLTVLDLASLLQCSFPTVRRRLTQWNTYTSYNHNGRYYVLPDVPQFDRHGLWRYRRICFSQYGNLTETVIGLIKNSPAGLDASEMGELLGIQPRSFLSLFRDHPALMRKQYQGHYVYFSAEATLSGRQIQQRGKMTLHAHRPSDSEAIAILVGAIKHPQMSIEELCVQLKKERHRITPQSVRNLFAYHGLPIKKTPRLP